MHAPLSMVIPKSLEFGSSCSVSLCADPHGVCLQGYSFSFRYTGDFEDKSERDTDGTVSNTVTKPNSHGSAPNPDQRRSQSSV